MCRLRRLLQLLLLDLLLRQPPLVTDLLRLLTLPFDLLLLLFDLLDLLLVLLLLSW
jgi:hypothetical protein